MYEYVLQSTLFKPCISLYFISILHLSTDGDICIHILRINVSHPGVEVMQCVSAMWRLLSFRHHSAHARHVTRFCCGLRAPGLSCRAPAPSFPLNHHNLLPSLVSLLHLVRRDTNLSAVFASAVYS